MLNLFRKKNLEDVLSDLKTIKIKGLKFKLKKIDAIHHMEGSKVMAMMYGTYEQKRASEKVQNLDFSKIKEHYRDVILAGVSFPKLARNEGEEGVFVDRLFVDWEIAEALYQEILIHTYGKKKIKQGTS